MDILNAVISNKISTDQIFDWLTKDNLQSTPFSDIVQTEATQAEFIVYFLDYVKKQCQSTLKIGLDDIENKEDSEKCRNDSTRSLKVTNVKQVHLRGVNSEVSTPKYASNSFEENLANTSINSGIIRSGLTSTPVKSNVITDITWPDLKSPLQTAHHPPEIFNESSGSNISNTPNLRYSVSSNQSFSSNVSNDISVAMLNQSQTSNCSIQNMSLNDSLISNTSMTRNISLYSPTSPLNAENLAPISHGNTKILTPKHNSATKNVRNKNSSSKKRKDSYKNHSMCLGDFLCIDKAGVSNSSEKKMTRSKRRIKPTQLQTYDNSENQQPQVFGVVNRPPTVNPQFTAVQSEEKSNKEASFQAERELLKLEKNKKPKVDILAQESVCQNKPQLSTIINVPNVDLVENIEVLKVLVNIYGGLLRRNFVPNLMTELYFMISLITAQYISEVKEEPETSMKTSKSDDLILQDSFEALKINLGCNDIDGGNDSTKSLTEISNSSEEVNQEKKPQITTKATVFFNTPHNCVYFATATLAQERSLLDILDRTTLKLLSDNRSVISFQPDLHSYLNELYTNKCLQSKQIESSDKSNVLQTNVCFEVETDNRENFLSPQSFSMFRKQRDLFYEILKTWEDCHLNLKWSFSSLENKIISMLNIYNESINYYHLARLIQLQLLMTSVENKQLAQSTNDEYSSVLEHMQHLDPNKLNQLEKRLVTPVTNTLIDPVPSPSFPGVQEFYRDFILVLSNPSFLTILEYCFIQEITELNEIQFTSSDIEDKECTVEESTKQNYFLAVSKLRILAKFLGLIISMPFRSETNSVRIIRTQIAVRSRVLPPLDLQKYLNDALKYGKLTLAIPWIVQYLAMLDAIAFRLPHYFKLCESLYYIYRSVHDFLNHKAALLITFSIGWLFELPNFPKNLFYHWHTNYDIKKIPIYSVTIDEVEENNSIVSSSLKEQNLILDNMEMVDDIISYTFCPFLNAFKVLLTSENSNFNNNSHFNRHITPVSTQLSQPSSATKAKTLQMQLQEAFFHGQPKSVKKTVDFVSERVASSCVKNICQTVIPKNEDMCYKIWKNTNRPLTLEEKTDKIIKITKSIKEQCQEEVKLMAQTKVKNAIESLLADDLLPAVKDMCIKITQKMAMERINQWLDFYINNMITYKSIEEKYSRPNPHKTTENADNSSDWKIDGEDYDPQAPAVTATIEELRNALWEVIEQHGRWSVLSEDQTLKVIQNLRRTLFNREDALPSGKMMLCKMSIDYALHIIVFKKDLMTPKVEDKFIELWKLYPETCKAFHNPLCGKNIKLLTNSRDKTVWEKYGKFIGRLLTDDILSWDQFCEQCVAILRQEWPPVVLKSIPVCLMETLGCSKNTNTHTEKIKGMIEWIAETCSGLNSNLF